MADKKLSFDQLAAFLPDGSLDAVVGYIQQHHIHFTITRERRTVLGNYKFDTRRRQHFITVNGNLNKYSFLITFLHEVAHLHVFEQYNQSVQPHGREWKGAFSRILALFVGRNIFPPDVAAALQRSLSNPGASTCGDAQLMKVLRNYDANPQKLVMVEDLSPGDKFLIKGGRLFVRGQKLKTRIKCFEPATQKHYLFAGIYEVKPVKETT